MTPKKSLGEMTLSEVWDKAGDIGIKVLNVGFIFWCFGLPAIGLGIFFFG